jgi:hypothetical protein
MKSPKPEMHPDLKNQNRSLKSPSGCAGGSVSAAPTQKRRVTWLRYGPRNLVKPSAPHSSLPTP